MKSPCMEATYTLRVAERTYKQTVNRSNGAPKK